MTATFEPEKNARLSEYETRIREAEPMPIDDVAPDAPTLGPDTLTWKFYGDWRIHVLGFQRIAGTENSIEQLGKAVSDHSVAFTDTVGRAKRTAIGLMNTVYNEDQHAWGRKVRDFHKPIKGTIDSDGSRYHALNPELFYWGHATFVDHLIYCTDTFIRRLTWDEKVQIFEESKIWYQLYGVSDRQQPETYEEFLEYWGGMVERFVPTKTMLYATGYIRQGVPGPKAIPKPVWKILSAPLNAFIRTMVVGTMPPKMREVCELEWDERKERNFQRGAALSRRLNPLFAHLPMKVSYTPWAIEAWARAGVDPRKIHNKPIAD